MTSAGAAADDAPRLDVRTLTPEQRYWWVHGAITTTSHLIGTYDKNKSECAASWYLRDRVAKQKLIEDTLAKYPNELPTTVILGLLTQACGKLAPS